MSSNEKRLWRQWYDGLSRDEQVEVASQLKNVDWLRDRVIMPEPDCGTIAEPLPENQGVTFKLEVDDHGVKRTYADKGKISISVQRDDPYTWMNRPEVMRLDPLIRTKTAISITCEPRPIEMSNYPAVEQSPAEKPSKIVYTD